MVSDGWSKYLEDAANSLGGFIEGLLTEGAERLSRALPSVLNGAMEKTGGMLGAVKDSIFPSRGSVSSGLPNMKKGSQEPALTQNIAKNKETPTVGSGIEAPTPTVEAQINALNLGSLNISEGPTTSGEIGNLAAPSVPTVQRNAQGIAV